VDATCKARYGGDVAPIRLEPLSEAHLPGLEEMLTDDGVKLASAASTIANASRVPSRRAAS